jgi:hypothetical protein
MDFVDFIWVLVVLETMAKTAEAVTTKQNGILQ